MASGLCLPPPNGHLGFLPNHIESTEDPGISKKSFKAPGLALLVGGFCSCLNCRSGFNCHHDSNNTALVYVVLINSCSYQTSSHLHSGHLDRTLHMAFYFSSLWGLSVLHDTSAPCLIVSPLYIPQGSHGCSHFMCMFPLIGSKMVTTEPKVVERAVPHTRSLMSVINCSSSGPHIFKLNIAFRISIS